MGERGKIRKVLSLCPSWQIGLAMLLSSTQVLLMILQARRIPYNCTSLGHILRSLQMNHAWDMMLSLFQNMAEEDQDDNRQEPISYVQKLFGDSENDLHQDAIVSLAADCCAWRKFVVICTAAKWWWWWLYTLYERRQICSDHLFDEFNGSQLAKMKKSIPDISLPWNL